jgi:hypothetical protein
VRPYVSIIAVAQCTIGVLMCEGPKDILHVIVHVLCVFLGDLSICYILIFPGGVKEFLVYLSI